MLPSEDHTKLVEQESTMEFLASIDAKIAVVAVIGPYRCKSTFSGLGCRLNGAWTQDKPAQLA